LGNKPVTLNAVIYSNGAALNLPKYVRKAAAEKSLLGVDLFVHWTGSNPDELAEIINLANSNKLELTMITNRGIKVWPAGFEETFCTDHWRCRFKSSNGINLSNQDIIALLQNANTYKIDVIKTENLYAFDGKPAFSLGQGQ
jgi:isocitrate dehydrogenase